MAICEKCGAQNVEQAAFCYRCGAPFTVRKEPRPAYVPQSQFDRSFKGAGPLLKAFIGIIFVLLVVEIFNVLSDSSEFADRVGDFLGDNLILIFIMMLLSVYSGYSSRRMPKEHSMVAPIIAAVLITFALWMMAKLMQITGDAVDVSVLNTMGDILNTILYIIFLLVLLLGYIGVVMRSNRIQPPANSTPYSQSAPSPQPVPQDLTQRLHRSKRDSVLFGVCGGMAEYTNIDPTMMRVLWVVGFLVSGGVLIIAYLILALALPNF
ncbi:MAG: PspC domain-containing protein [Methanomassiliicoccales archaeon]|nr:PspC domain-containing protein [Methanomassiliicoccales archaeon]